VPPQKFLIIFRFCRPAGPEPAPSVGQVARDRLQARSGSKPAPVQTQWCGLTRRGRRSVARVSRRARAVAPGSAPVLGSLHGPQPGGGEPGVTIEKGRHGLHRTEAGAGRDHLEGQSGLGDEPRIRRATLTEVPLTGLSLNGRARLSGDGPCIQLESNAPPRRRLPLF
jgi:hypothetical protein